MKKNLGRAFVALVVVASPTLAHADAGVSISNVASILVSGGVGETQETTRSATSAEQWPGQQDQANDAEAMKERSGVGMKVDEEVKGSAVFAAENEGVPVVAKNTYLSTGYIVDNFEQFAEVIDGTFSAQNIFSAPEDIVYISKGEQDGVNIGDRFAVVHEGDEMTDPQSGDSLGIMVYVDGVIEITDVAADSAEAIILTSYNTIERGDALIRHREKNVPTIDPDAPLEKKNISARIVTGYGSQKGYASDDVIFLSAGTNQGVAVGDVFDIKGEEKVTRRDGSVVDGLPKFRARARVFETKERISTALIIHSIASVSRGNLATYALER